MSLTRICILTISVGWRDCSGHWRRSGIFNYSSLRTRAISLMSSLRSGELCTGLAGGRFTMTTLIAFIFCSDLEL